MSIHLLQDVSSPGMLFGISNHRVNVGTISQAVSLVLQLLGIFVPNLGASPNVKENDAFIRQNRIWAYNGYQRLWKSILYWLKNAEVDMQQCVAQISMQFLTCLRIHCIQETFLPVTLSPKLVFTYLWFQCLADVLALETLGRIPNLELGLSRFLNGLGEFCKQPQAAACMEDVLVPVVVDVGNGSIVQTLEPCLLVTLICCNRMISI